MLLLSTHHSFTRLSLAKEERLASASEETVVIRAVPAFMVFMIQLRDTNSIQVDI